jgi:integrase/recombinase XerD
MRTTAFRDSHELWGPQMKQREYSSVLGSCILDFIAMKRASGHSYETAERYLHEFDCYCRSQTVPAKAMRELIIGWAQARNGEEPATHRVRVSPVRELGRYMQSLGIPDAYVLPSACHGRISRYVPHFFTKTEITSFFLACDNLKPHGAMKARHLVLPVFFRLLYCCGVRTGEARKLRVGEVDLSQGTITILGAKRHSSRRIPLPHDLLELFRTYDARVSRIYPGRVFFFPTTASECYACSSISLVFGKIWNAAELRRGTGSRPRAYDFRHHFALTVLNRWIVSGAEVNAKLPYLTRYMGHAAMMSTDYYLHLVPEFFHAFAEKVRATENVLPEVDYEPV